MRIEGVNVYKALAHKHCVSISYHYYAVLKLNCLSLNSKWISYYCYNRLEERDGIPVDILTNYMDIQSFCLGLFVWFFPLYD